MPLVTVTWQVEIPGGESVCLVMPPSILGARAAPPGVDEALMPAKLYLWISRAYFLSPEARGTQTAPEAEAAWERWWRQKGEEEQRTGTAWRYVNENPEMCAVKVMTDLSFLPEM